MIDIGFTVEKYKGFLKSIIVFNCVHEVLGIKSSGVQGEYSVTELYFQPSLILDNPACNNYSKICLQIMR